MKFITISNERSGSSFLQRLLDSHPNIRARQEDLRSSHQKNDKFLYDLYFNSRCKKKTLGFKALYGHLYRGIFDFIKRYNIKVIQLIRRDLLECVLWYRAGTLANVKDFNKIGPLGTFWKLEDKVEVDIERVKKYLIKLNKDIDKYRRYADITIYYKDFTNNQNSDCFYNKEVRRELLEFLGVDDRELQVSQKINKKNIRPSSKECIKNWDELMKELKDIRIYYK